MAPLEPGGARSDYGRVQVEYGGDLFWASVQTFNDDGTCRVVYEEDGSYEDVSCSRVHAPPEPAGAEAPAPPQGAGEGRPGLWAGRRVGRGGVAGSPAPAPAPAERAPPPAPPMPGGAEGGAAAGAAAGGGRSPAPAGGDEDWELCLTCGGQGCDQCRGQAAPEEDEEPRAACDLDDAELRDAMGAATSLIVPVERQVNSLRGKVSTVVGEELRALLDDLTGYVNAGSPRLGELVSKTEALRGAMARIEADIEAKEDADAPTTQGLHRELPEERLCSAYGRGFSMLSAMGFESGSGCGRRGQGISAPVHATARARLGRDRLGIGAETCRAGLGATADDAGGAAEGPAAPTRWVPAADVPPRAPGAPERRAFARPRSRSRSPSSPASPPRWAWARGGEAPAAGPAAPPPMPLRPKAIPARPAASPLPLPLRAKARPARPAEASAELDCGEDYDEDESEFSGPPAGLPPSGWASLGAFAAFAGECGSADLE